jgi:hypothetical protein
VAGGWCRKADCGAAEPSAPPYASFMLTSAQTISRPDEPATLLQQARMHGVLHRAVCETVGLRAERTYESTSN